ncbi:bis(5'-nucleosyl)-tetraphosphatase (symmetrical) YqeK [Proteiniborus sp.]|uniref:bis(5'-nucleosyl)-tetraphosphatase (symmetrical) YqeK n=1 Tax=Proteiniborus sp. TaxID=2079015 RepID=UPI00332CF58B
MTKNSTKIVNQSETKLIHYIGYKRYLHSLRVMEEAIKLATKFNCDGEKAAIAGFLHDCGKLQDEHELLKKSYDFGIIQRDVHIDNFALLHGALGAEIARREFQIEDIEIINAIRYHTTGRPNMSLLEKIIYISDYIEPERKFPGVDAIRTLAYKDLDEALLKAMDKTIKYIIDKGQYIHPETLNARNYLIKENK